MNKEQVKKWEKQTQELADYFVKKYFGKDVEVYWVADNIGGVLFVNDYFFNPQEMVDYFRYNYSKKQMFEHYEYNIECATNKIFAVNIKNYLKLKDEVHRL